MNRKRQIDQSGVLNKSRRSPCVNPQTSTKRLKVTDIPRLKLKKMMRESELFPTTIHLLDNLDIPQRPRSHTIYFGPKSGYKCHCGKEFGSIRHLSIHRENRHSHLMNKMMNWMKNE